MWLDRHAMTSIPGFDAFSDHLATSATWQSRAGNNQIPKIDVGITAESLRSNEVDYYGDGRRISSRNNCCLQSLKRCLSVVLRFILAIPCVDLNVRLQSIHPAATPTKFKCNSVSIEDAYVVMMACGEGSVERKQDIFKLCTTMSSPFR